MRFPAYFSLVLNFYIRSSHAFPQLSPSLETPYLLISDEGVGGSVPDPKWSPSLRRIDTSGAAARKILDINAGSGAGALTLDQSNNAYVYTFNGIQRVSQDGTNSKIIIPDGRGPITVSGNKIYYGTDYGRVIARANLDGSDAQQLLNISISTPGHTIRGIAIDQERGYMYWSSTTSDLWIGNGAIRRAPLETPQAIQPVTAGIAAPGQLRMIGGWLYFAEEGSSFNSSTALWRITVPYPGTTRSATTNSHEEVEKRAVYQRLVHSDGSAIFKRDDYTFRIYGYAVDEAGGKLWLALKGFGPSTKRAYGKIVEASFADDGVKILNENELDIGVPTAVEWVQ